MKFLSIHGKCKFVRNPHNYRINWNGKSRSKFQRSVKRVLFKYWHGDDVYEEFPVAGTLLSLDFYNRTKNIAIEVQGGQHQKFNKHFHKVRANFILQVKRDIHKRDFCESNNITLLEILPEDEISDLFIAQLLDKCK